MLAAAPDRFTVFCCDATLGLLVVAAVMYFLVRAFRKGREPGDGPPRAEE